MARTSRTWEEDALYHLVFKGVLGGEIVSDEEERCEVLRRLDHVAEKYGFAVLVFCCMKTHVHLLIRAGEGDVSKAMQELISGYARWRNKRYAVRGNLFLTRFWSKQQRSDRQFFATIRYIELNPVAAGLCDNPEEWEWSSCRAHLGLAHPPRFLAGGELLRFYARDRETARSIYEGHVREGVPGARAKARRKRRFSASLIMSEIPAWFDLPTMA
jgi:REP element-mobilizing transposase RayT